MHNSKAIPTARMLNQRHPNYYLVQNRRDEERRTPEELFINAPRASICWIATATKKHKVDFIHGAAFIRIISRILNF